MLFLLIACTAAPPTVDAVSPDVGSPGDTIRVVGSDFAEGVSATLGGQALEDLVVYAATLEGAVPAGLAPGEHDLVVTGAGGQAITLAGAFTVKGSEPLDLGVPCAGDFTAYSTIVTNQKQFVIDRRYKGDDSKNVVARLAFKDITGIQYEEVRMEGGKDDGKICAAIWVTTKDDKRHLFDDDTEVRLRKRAQEIAVGVQKPFDIVAEVKDEEAEE